MKSRKLAFLAGTVAAMGAAMLPGGMRGAPQAARSGQSEASVAAGTTINAEFDSTVDSKKVKIGDAVAAHVSEAVKSSDDRIILPKSTKLVGHITEALARSKGDPDSVIGIYFDKAILKGGEEVSLKVTIQALAAPASSSGSGMGDFSGSPGPSNTSSNSSGNMGGNRSAGGMGTGRPTNYPQSSGPAADDGVSAAGGATAPDRLTAKSRGVYGMEGVKLSTVPANNVETSVIASNGKNVHLNGGTRMVLLVHP